MLDSGTEKKRLEALYDLQILESCPEVPFDELAKLAAQICNTPYAVVAFVDRDRQWFKSTFGIHFLESPRRGGFCEYAILEKKFFQVANASKDERFQNHPLVTGPESLRSYAAVPIEVNGGLNIGLIAVGCREEKELSVSEIEGLKSLAHLARHLLETRRSSSAMQDLLRFHRESEKNAVHLSQMKELAEMAGGLAHEITNPLAILKLTLESLQKELSPELRKNSVLSKHFQRFGSATDRIHKLVRGLVTYARDSRKDGPVFTSLKTVIEDTLQFCQIRLKEIGVRLDVENFDPNLGVWCRPVEISQVILNLINNSCDAIQDLQQKWIRIQVFETAEEISISITDSGKGIPSSLRAQIFRPFFTTKKVNQGTGLGLGICRSLIEGHGGTLTLDSEASHTCFVVKIPKKHRAAA